MEQEMALMATDKFGKEVENWLGDGVGGSGARKSVMGRDLGKVQIQNLAALNSGIPESGTELKVKCYFQ